MTTSTSDQSAGGSAGAGKVLVLEAPTVVDALPDGLIPARFNFTDLRISLDTPWAVLPGPGRVQYVIFEWHVQGARSVDTPPYELRGPLTDDDFPIDDITIPRAFLLSSAIVDLRYRIHNTRPDSPSVDTSSPVTIRIDRDAPGVGALLAPAIFPIDPITQPYLDANPMVPMEIPEGYLGREVGDKVLMYFSDMNMLPTGLPTLVSPPLTSDSGRILVDVPREVFRTYPGALWLFCFYRLEDRAGNVNPTFSLLARVGLATDLPPIEFTRPEFPQALLHPNRFMTCSTQPPIWFGVEVAIPADPNIQHGDLVTLRFQGYGQYPDVNPDPNIVETLEHYWDAVADATGYNFWIRDVERVIRPLKKNAGGEASYLVTRAGTIMGRSVSRYVQFDRVVLNSGPDPLYCWLGGNGPEP